MHCCVNPVSISVYVTGTVADDPGRTLLVGSTDDPQSYTAGWLASLPFPFTIEGGDEVVEALRSLAARLTAATRA